jgi:hypothetical protein
MSKPLKLKPLPPHTYYREGGPLHDILHHMMALPFSGDIDVAMQPILDIQGMTGFMPSHPWPHRKV